MNQTTLSPEAQSTESRRDALLHDAAGITPLDRAIVMMIRAHVGKPCPTRKEIMSWTYIPRRQVWLVLGEVAERGVIEIEVCDRLPALRRRLRVAGEEWTLWTARRPGTETEKAA